MTRKLDLDQLLEIAREIEVTPEMREAQRRSFVYGNCKLDNDNITRELVDEVADAMAAAAADK